MVSSPGKMAAGLEISDASAVLRVTVNYSSRFHSGSCVLGVGSLLFISIISNLTAIIVGRKCRWPLKLSTMRRVSSMNCFHRC